MSQSEPNWHGYSDAERFAIGDNIAAVNEYKAGGESLARQISLHDYVATYRKDHGVDGMPEPLTSALAKMAATMPQPLKHGIA